MQKAFWPAQLAGGTDDWVWRFVQREGKSTWTIGEADGG